MKRSSLKIPFLWSLPVAVLLLSLAGVCSAAGEEQADAGGSDQVTETPMPESAKQTADSLPGATPEAEPKQDNAPVADPAFVPSEEISEDLSVPFPVDI